MRLRLMRAVAAALAGATALPGFAAITIPGVVRQAPGVYRFTIGDARVTVMSDGTMPVDAHRMMKGATPAEIDTLLARNFLANPIQPSINAFLIEMGGRTILVDTGRGSLFGPGEAGRLPEALAIAGVRPEQVDEILITHAHPDHIGGLTDNGRIVFPKAIVHVGKPDLDFFLDGRKFPEGSPGRLASDLVGSVFKPYIDAGKVDAFERDGEILPGISAELRPGHSPGSAIFRLKSRGQELVIVGDVIHVAAVQLDRLDVDWAYDQDPAMARRDREHSLHEFARAGTLIAAPHISFPGLGYIRVEGKTYRWVPVEYGNRDPDLPAPKF